MYLNHIENPFDSVWEAIWKTENSTITEIEELSNLKNPFDSIWDIIWKMEHTTTTDTLDLAYLRKTNYIVDAKDVTAPMKMQVTTYKMLIPLVGFIVMVLNLAVVISSIMILKRKQEPKCTYLLMGNVAFADVMIGLSLTFGQIYPKSHRTHSTCGIFLGFIVAASMVSIYSVALIAVDRFIYIVHGLKYHKWMYLRRLRIFIVAIWILGLTVGFLPMMGLSNDTQNGRVCWYIVLASKEALIVSIVVGVIPLILVVTLYSIILYYAIKKVIQLKNTGKIPTNDAKLRVFRGGQSDRSNSNNTVSTDASFSDCPKVSQKSKIFFISFKNNSSPNGNQNGNAIRNNSTKWKAIKIILLMSGGCMITWGPYIAMCTVYVICDPEKELQRCIDLRFAIASPLAILVFVNCVLNPIIYAWLHDGFRKTITKILIKKCRR